MWSLESVSARNIGSFRQLEYTLQQGVTTLIFGNNTDNESQKSNGSGKSTLIEAVSFGITGTPLRKVRSEEIINDNAEECTVRLTFSNSLSGERLTVDRQIFRKGTSEVRCSILESELETTVELSSVEAHNRYILDRLGITREELFSSFILSKHRYQAFLSCSDKEKKEIINRFSNGILVDQAIEQIEADLSPLRDGMRQADLDFAGVEGRIQMLSEQIQQEDRNRQQNEQSRQQKIATLRATISEKRTVVRGCKEEIAVLKALGENIGAVDQKISALEDSDTSLELSMNQVRGLLHGISDTRPTDWTQMVALKNEEISDAGAELDKWTAIIAKTGQKIADAQKSLSDTQREHEAFKGDAQSKDSALDEEIQELRRRLEAANDQLTELKGKRRALSSGIELLSAKLAGTITCPSCQHKFLVSDNDFDVDAATVQLNRDTELLEAADDRLLDNELEAEKVQQMMVHVRSEKKGLSELREQWADRLAKAEREVKAAEYEMEGARFTLKRVQDFIAARSRETEDMRRGMFDEAFDIMESASRNLKRRESEHKEMICAAQSSIDTLQNTIVELENTSGSELISSLKKSLSTYRKESAKLLEQKTRYENKIDTLQTQQQVFIQFKSFLANSKIDALAGMMNSILTDLGSDIRVNMSGYTLLKSGAIREKISVSLFRDGIDIGSFGKCSAGEAARVNLSSLLAMQRLINSNADDGRGLDLLVLDEILDAVDETGLANVFSALNKIGVTALVVSHGLVTEGYPHKITITKENGESRIASQ